MIVPQRLLLHLFYSQSSTVKKPGRLSVSVSTYWRLALRFLHQTCTPAVHSLHMLDEQRPRHLPAARGFIRKRRPFLTPRVTAVTTVDGEVESLTGPVTLTEVSTISVTSASTSSSVSTTAKTSTTATTMISSTLSASSARSSPSSLSSSTTSSHTSLSTSAVPVSITPSPSASAVANPSATMTVSAQNAIGAEETGSPKLSGGTIAAIAIGVLVLVSAAVVLIGRRYLAMRRQKKRATARWLNGFSAPNTGAFTGPDKFSTQPPMSVVEPSYGTGYAYTPTINVASNVGTRGEVAGLPTPATPVASFNNAPTTPGTALSSFVNRTAVRRTFVPNLPDELTVLNGEMLDVLQEYDDGWVLCSNSKGETGMVPLECLTSKSETGSDFWGERSMRGSRRVSSISGRV
ncbi:hypothetical protein F5050DRAFT_876530 [Lentinula boryana]|uniref:SH3 domain-containing protein n=1 Tax=Lentinula boryana TaxID=40481 RepID=A0ABQ8QMG6_9AGAR|nr:hypothetical protein F5050DRAFT_876530 [Lentinula boryana]